MAGKIAGLCHAILNGIHLIEIEELLVLLVLSLKHDICVVDTDVLGQLTILQEQIIIKEE
jgi:hypothetical protein